MQLRKTLHIISLELVKRSVYGQNPPPTYTETPWVTEPPPPQGWLTVALPGALRPRHPESLMPRHSSALHGMRALSLSSVSAPS